LIELGIMGYTNFRSNLVRVRKFEVDHINGVITDYIAHPDEEETDTHESG